MGQVPDSEIVELPPIIHNNWRAYIFLIFLRMWKQKLPQNFNAPLTYIDQFNRLYYSLKGCTVTRFMTGQRSNFPTADTVTTTVISAVVFIVS